MKLVIFSASLGLAALVGGCGDHAHPADDTHTHGADESHIHASGDDHDHQAVTTAAHDHDHADRDAHDHESETAGEHSHADEADHHHDEDGEAQFDADTGLTFSPHALESLQPRTIVAQTHTLRPTRTLRGRIFTATPRLLASAHVPAAEADVWQTADFAPATLREIDRGETAATSLVDLIVALAPSPGARIGDFVDIPARLAPVEGLLVPREAVLTTAAGDFVYVQTGAAWRRVPVAFTSVAEGALVTRGLPVGATVLVSPPTAFWLTELRLTKGGGHSH